MTETLGGRPPTTPGAGAELPFRVDHSAALLPSWTPYVAGALGIPAGLAAMLWTATHLQSDQVLHEVALFAHLSCLVIGFGAVLAVDWMALQWAAGRRMLSDVLRTAGEVHVPIWVGYSGLVLSGVFLSPDLTSPVTQAKLALVLVIGWNGLAATWLQRHLRDRPGGVTLVVSAICAGVSQGAWWGAAVIGFLNAR